MPANNPYAYAEDEMKRRAQVGMLDGGTSSTMPVSDPIRDITGGANGGVVTPAAVAGRPTWHVDPTTDMGTLQGFDARNMADPQMQSVKYRHGRLARGITKPSDMAALVQSQAYQAAFPGATFDGKDRVNFAGALADGDHGPAVSIIDVLRAADRDTDTSEGGWWGPLEDEIAAMESSAPSSGVRGGLHPAADNSALTKILAELNATQNEDMSPAEREAMLAMLQGI